MNEDLREKIRVSMAWFDSLSPVDKAIHRVQQRMSFVRGNIGIDTEWTPAHQRALEEDHAVVLMNEVLHLRAVASPTRLCPRENGHGCVKGCNVDYTDFCSVTGRRV